MGETGIKYTMYGVYASLIAMFEFLGLQAFEMGVLAMLMIFDVITGLAKQWRLDKQGITSNRLTVGIFAKLLILLCVVSIALTIKAIGLEFTKDYLTIAVAILIGGECYSIVANTYTFKTKEELPEYDIVSKLLGSIMQALKDFIDKYLIQHK